jgi:hypothetical protein
MAPFTGDSTQLAMSAKPSPTAAPASTQKETQTTKPQQNSQQQQTKQQEPFPTMIAITVGAFLVVISAGLLAMLKRHGYFSDNNLHHLNLHF